jgi:SAM-dependent methyltransferase
MNLAEQAKFHENYPFDWFENYHGEDLRKVISAPLLEVIDALPQGALVLDAGCGPGRVLSYLGFRGVNCIGLDRSTKSISIVVSRHKLPGAVANNLQLPICNDAADVVISDGVLHHTDDPSRGFSEDCRVLKPGGKLYLAVYRPGGRYEFLYKYPGGIIRALVKHSATRWIAHSTALPIYFSAHWLKSGGKVTWRGARNLFYDYFMSPTVEFLSKSTIEDWGSTQGMKLLRYERNPTQNVHCFLFQKQ